MIQGTGDGRGTLCGFVVMAERPMAILTILFRASNYLLDKKKTKMVV